MRCPVSWAVALCCPFRPMPFSPPVGGASPCSAAIGSSRSQPENSTFAQTICSNKTTCPWRYQWLTPGAGSVAWVGEVAGWCRIRFFETIKPQKAHPPGGGRASQSPAAWPELFAHNGRWPRRSGRWFRLSPRPHYGAVGPAKFVGQGRHQGLQKAAIGAGNDNPPATQRRRAGHGDVACKRWS